MKRMIIATIAALAMSACASTPGASNTPAEKILGAWDCTASSQGAVVAGKFNYATGGKATADATMDVETGGMKIWLAGDLNATWGFQPDGKLIETVTSLKVTQAKMDGKDIPPMAISSMVQPMVNQSVVGKASTSTVVFDGTTMTSTDEEGVVTTCKR